MPRILIAITRPSITTFSRIENLLSEFGLDFSAEEGGLEVLLKQSSQESQRFVGEVEIGALSNSDKHKLLGNIRNIKPSNSDSEIEVVVIK